MNRRLWMTALLTSFSMLVAGTAVGQQGLKTGKVGVIVQLSGVSGDFGVGVQHAVEIAKQELADNKIIDLQVFYEDHQQQAQLALVGFEKLVDRNDVSVVIANASPVILALAPVAEERKRLVYNFAGVSPKLRSLNRWVINGAALSDRDGSELAQYMVKKLGLKTAAVLHVDDQFGTSVAEYFQNAYKAAGGKIVDVESNPVGALDLRTQLLKIKAANPEALVILNNIPEEGYSVAQAREIGITAKIFSNTFMMDPQNVKAAGAAINGVRGMSLQFDPERSPIAKEFATKFAKKAGRPPAITDVLAYDGARLIGEAMQKVGNDPRAVRDYIVKVKDWPGAIGKINFDAEGNILLDMSQYEFVNGKPVFTNP
ncbi:MAG TPA: ABC transporter substrate-binding protein [Casimicrobiaceae bacterium]|nr:ABC transporter substrate-binding protein [Casimicrobiaceae bacterium]